MTEERSTHASQQANVQEDDIDLRKLVGVLIDEWRWISLTAMIVFLTVLAYAFLATPIYDTNALIQVEESDGGLNALGELSTILSGEAPTEGEVEIVRSRTVLGAAIEQQNLEILARPKFFPVIGPAIFRAYKESGVRPALLGLGAYAWGGEKIQVSRFSVPPSMEGKGFTLTAGTNGDYRIDISGEFVLDGRVGQPESEAGLEIFVVELQSRPGTQFSIRRLNRLDAINRLRAGFSVAERGKKTGILDLRLEGESPVEIADTLNAITNTYLRQNVERTSEDAAQTLEFLNMQLPQLKSQLEGAEAALNQYRVSRGSIDLSLETQGLLEKVGEVESQISQLELKQAELSQRYTTEHPALIALAEQRIELQSNRASLENRVRDLPAAERDSLRLMRDVRVSNELYLHLLNRAQELKVVRAGTVGNVRVIDPAFVPRKPHKPRVSPLLALGLLAGLVSGIVVVLLREAFNPTIRDPKTLEDRTGLPIYAIVPHSSSELSLNSDLARRGVKGSLLADEKPDDPTIESLRSLRTSLDFLLLDAERKTITISGPAPGAGKSFVAANLAVLFANAGKKTLLIDVDMRKGHLHRLFHLGRDNGLADVIIGTVAIEDAIKSSARENLDFLSTGEIPPNPSELVTSTRFASLLEKLSDDYDVVLMDAPPVLGAAEALTLARLAAVALLVVRYDQQTPREVELTLTKLRQTGATPRGFVFNDLKAQRSQHRYSGYHYYQYKDEVKKK